MTASGNAARPAIAFGATVILVGTLGLAYIVSQFLRNSIGVIAPDLAAELSLSASQIGLLSSTFFFAFAGAQIPLGLALDRYGPKICMVVCAGIAACGAVFFAMATTPFGLIAARILMGIGSCCYFMAPLTLYARRYPPERFATFVGVQYGLGTLGTLFATAPLALSVAAIGWRTTFIVVALGMIVAGALVALVVREDAAPDTDKGETFRQSISGMMQAMRTRSVGALFFMHVMTYSSFLLVVALWGGPYLTHVYGYGLTARGNVLFIAVVAQIAGSVMWGWADQWFGGYKQPVLLGAGLTILALAAVAFFGILPEVAVIAWFAAIGFFTAYVSVLIAHGKSLFPPALVGRGITILNIGTMGGAFLTQTLSGFMIDLFPTRDGAYALEAYRLVFGLQAFFLLLACVGYLRARDPRAQTQTPQ